MTTRLLKATNFRSRMKSILFCLIFLAINNPNTGAKAYNYQGGIATTASVVKFKEQTYDFGKRTRGSEVSHTFSFKNVGKETISIREVRTSCGCTTPKYSKDPIKVHHKGKILVKYDSSHEGQFEKVLDVVISNGEEIRLTITGEIIENQVQKK